MQNTLRHPATIGSSFLANFAAAWGFVVAPIYLVAFVLLLPHAVAGGHGPGTVTLLPLELPLIGLFLGVLSLALGRCGNRSTRGPCLLGIVLNAVPTVLAVVLQVLHDGVGFSWPMF